MNVTHNWWHLQNALLVWFETKGLGGVSCFVSQMEFVGAQTWDFHFGNGMWDSLHTLHCVC